MDSQIICGTREEENMKDISLLRNTIKEIIILKMYNFFIFLTKTSHNYIVGTNHTINSTIII